MTTHTWGYIRLPHCPLIQMSRRGLSTDAGWDLHIADDIIIPPYAECEVPTIARTGIVLVLSPGYWAAIYARSSLSKHGLALPNSVGVIDAGYTGEVKILLYNRNKTAVELSSGAALAQVVLHQLPQHDPAELTEDPRQVSRGGLGSTGGYVIQRPTEYAPH